MMTAGEFVGGGGGGGEFINGAAGEAAAGALSMDMWRGGEALGQAVHVDMAVAVPSVLGLVACMQIYRVFAYFVP